MFDVVQVTFNISIAVLRISEEGGSLFTVLDVVLARPKHACTDCEAHQGKKSRALLQRQRCFISKNLFGKECTP